MPRVRVVSGGSAGGLGRWWGRLPPLTRAAVAVGVPAVTMLAIALRSRGAAAPPPAEPIQDELADDDFEELRPERPEFSPAPTDAPPGPPINVNITLIVPDTAPPRPPIVWDPSPGVHIPPPTLYPPKRPPEPPKEGPSPLPPGTRDVQTGHLIVKDK